MKKILVIPTIRKNSFLEFQKAWDKFGDWDEMIVVEDTPTKTFDSGAEHYSHSEIHEILGDDSWIISKRDSAIRSFGFLMAYKKKADYILTLDDDCHPTGVPIFDTHIRKMQHQPRWCFSIPNVRTRGIPYRINNPLQNVVVNMGLWENVPDFDAVTALNYNDEYFNPPVGNRIIPNGQYTAICGMNLCFRYDVTPLMYFPLMGEGQPFKRFDDIWCGIIMKKVTDHLRYNVLVGEPFVNHKKASNVFDNLIKEAPGIKANEFFWQLIDDIELKMNTPEECMIEVGTYLQNNNNDYISTLGKAIHIWIKTLQMSI